MAWVPLAAAFGRLCVETRGRVQGAALSHAAAFGRRLCVETAPLSRLFLGPVENYRD